ncbi:MAG: molybdenum cofactor biosynthesis protein MoaE [Desulfobacterales bacterium]
MDIAGILAQIRQLPDFNKAGMVLVHNGVVRETSRDGRRVKGLRVAVDRERLERILAEQKKRPGIVDIRVEIDADRDLAVGDDVMLLAVAGDIRETVIAVLTDTLNLIKKTVTSKTEIMHVGIDHQGQA